MEQHFVHALDLQIAVIGGDLDAAHAAADRLGAVSVESGMPPSWRPFLADVRAAAADAVHATTVAEEAMATSRIGLACGECHVATGGGPKEPVPEAPSGPHMALHLYGAYWMGFGLLAPSDVAWTRGAGVLAEAALRPEGWTPPAGMADVDARVHELARRATELTDASHRAERAEVWGELLGTCSQCHVALPR